MTRTEAARLVGHNYRHLGVTFGKPWERIDRCGPGEYVGRHRVDGLPLNLVARQFAAIRIAQAMNAAR